MKRLIQCTVFVLAISLLGCADAPRRTPAMSSLDIAAENIAEKCNDPNEPESINNFQYGCFCGKGHPYIKRGEKANEEYITAYYGENKPKDDIDKICRGHDVCWIQHGDGDSKCNEELRESLRRISDKFSDRARIAARENWGNRTLIGRCGEENERPRCKWMRCSLMADGMADAFLTIFAPNTGTERQTRYVMLVKLKGKDTETVINALIKNAKKLPDELYQSLTWDRGKEMAAHKRFTLATDIKVYFCDPRSPWQRGSNENTNRLLRQYFPKGTDLSVHSQAKLNAVARQLNERPRKTLDYETPAVRFNACVAATS